MFDTTASIAGNGGRETTLGRASRQLPDSALSALKGFHDEGVKPPPQICDTKDAVDNEPAIASGPKRRALVSTAIGRSIVAAPLD